MMGATQSSFLRSSFVRLCATLLIVIGAIGDATRSSASPSGAAASPIAVVAAATPGLSMDPGQQSADCLKRDDTACAVLVWKQQFALKPHDDQTRRSLVDAYLLDCFRSLDKGDLPEARAALKQAKALIPSSPDYQYYQEALDAYQSVLFGDDLAIEGEFDLASTSSAGLEYPEVSGVFGAPTTVVKLTEPTPDWWQALPVWGLAQSPSSSNAAFRFEMLPMNTNGSTYAIFGSQDASNYFAAQFLWIGGSSAKVEIYQHDSSGWTAIGKAQYVEAAQNTWHQVEVRISGQNVQVWFDTALAQQQTVPGYRPGGFGFGVGLGQVQQGVTFSAEFYDFIIYQLAG